MKKLLVAAIASVSLFAVVSPARAMNFAYGQNENGGLIILTTTHSDCPAGSDYAYATSSAGAVRLAGCWTYNEPVVSVYWRTNGNSRQYQTSDFTITDEWNKANVERKRAQAAGM